MFKMKKKNESSRDEDEDDATVRQQEKFIYVLRNLQKENFEIVDLHDLLFVIRKIDNDSISALADVAVAFMKIAGSAGKKNNLKISSYVTFTKVFNDLLQSAKVAQDSSSFDTLKLDANFVAFQESVFDEARVFYSTNNGVVSGLIAAYLYEINPPEWLVYVSDLCCFMNIACIFIFPLL